jgi:hypothetical protein
MHFVLRSRFSADINKETKQRATRTELTEGTAAKAGETVGRITSKERPRFWVVLTPKCDRALAHAGDVTFTVV